MVCLFNNDQYRQNRDNSWQTKLLLNGLAGKQYATVMLQGSLQKPGTVITDVGRKGLIRILLFHTIGGLTDTAAIIR